MRKRILSILLTLCMLLCLVPTAVFAEGAPTGTPLTQALLGTWLEKEDPYNPNSGKIYKMPGGNYYLAADIYLVGDDADPNSAWPLIISEGDVTLDLNGHVLDLKERNISIYSNGNLTLTDSSPNAEHKFRVEDSGLWVLDETQRTKTVAGGVITGGTGVDSATGTLGGGVNVTLGSLTMNGGSIVGCTANNGGGVSVSSGSFTMTGGSIVGCTADSGGGVHVDGNSSFTMRDGAISGCTAAYGGGVYVGNLATFNMNDGSIKDCTADIGGGVYMGGLAKFNMSGGGIESCTADNGGGVYVGSGARFEMNSGSEGKDPTIKNCIAVRAGGGVFVEANIYSDDGTFTMTGGSIANCTAGDAANAVHADGKFDGTAKDSIPNAQLTGINAGHTGGETDPILIGSAEGLNDFRNKVNGGQTTLCAKLVCDIVLNDGTFDENGTYTGANGSTSAEQWTPIGWYKSDSNQAIYAGTFDGGGHTIKGLYINRDESGIGLFRIVSNATIKNLTVTGYVKGYGSVGGIVGEILEEGNATIQNCANYCEVTGDTHVGGIVGYIGYNTKGDIRNCANFGTVKGTCTDSFAYIGGIVGRASVGQEMTVVCTACYNVGTVKAKKCAGGLLGYGSMKMDSCYNVGLVEGEEFIGGLVGSATWLIIDGNGMSLVTVDNCYYLDTATKAFGEAQFFAGDTSAWRKSKTQFANELLPLLQNGDENSPWAKCGYLAAAGMTLPLLSWQTADAHTHDYQWKYDNTEHWKECSCGFIEQGSKAAHKEVKGICTDGIKCACGYEMHTATGGHSYPTNWSPVRPGSTHIKACRNPGCGVMQSNSCTGGTATCTEQAICEACGEKYGTTNPNNHSYEWQSENGQYWQKCKLCGFETDKKDIPTIVFTGSDKVCRSQDYTFSFTLPEGATDAEWGYEFINLAGGPITPTLENGRYYGVMDSDYYSKSENSFKLIMSAKTADGFEFRTEKIVTVLDDHTGGTATCTEQATCEICGEKYGDLKPHSYSPDWRADETNHWHECTECEAKTDESEHTDIDKNHKCDICEKVLSICADTNQDHKCDLCGKALSEHTGGTATCTAQAVCEVCGENYGELDVSNHTDMKHIEAIAATRDAEGNIEYWYCADCDRYFSDAAATKEITNADTVTARLPEENRTSPKTGSSGNLLVWIALLFISGGVITVTTVVSKKKRHS